MVQSVYPSCPDCNHEMRKVIEFSKSCEGTPWSVFLFQCPNCKRIDECGQDRWDKYYYIIKGEMFEI